MPGISMCARPKSAVFITSCPTARSCHSVRTIPCTGPGICRSIKLSGVRRMEGTGRPWVQGDPRGQYRSNTKNVSKGAVFEMKTLIGEAFVAEMGGVLEHAGIEAQATCRKQ